MARPHKCRWIGANPPVRMFKPAGVPLRDTGEVVLRRDELEALRLGDLEGLYHGEAAKQINVSRATFGRLIESARRKVAQALVQGLAVRVEGGTVAMKRDRHFICSECKHRFAVTCGTPRPDACPACNSGRIHRDAEERGHACTGNQGQERHHHGECCGHGAGRGHAHGRHCHEQKPEHSSVAEKA